MCSTNELQQGFGVKRWQLWTPSFSGCTRMHLQKLAWTLYFENNPSLKPPAEWLANHDPRADILRFILPYKCTGLGSTSSGAMCQRKGWLNPCLYSRSIVEVWWRQERAWCHVGFSIGRAARSCERCLRVDRYDMMIYDVFMKHS